MKKTLIILSSVLALVLPVRAAYSLQDTIVAIVNKEIITLKDLREFLAAKHMQLKTEGLKPEEIVEIMHESMTVGLNRLIEERLLVNESDKKGLVIRDEFVDQRLNEVKSEFPNEVEFIDSLTKDGITMTDLKNKIKDQIKAQSIIDYEVRSKIFVNPQEVTEYYEKHASEFLQQERANVESIFVKNETDPDATARKLNDVQESLKQNDFSAVAKQFSSRPSLGIVTKGKFKPEIEQVIFGLNVGGVSSPVAVEGGYYIFKLSGHSPAAQIPLEKIQRDIRNKIYQEKFRKRVQEFLEKLKRDAFIEIKQ